MSRQTGQSLLASLLLSALPLAGCARVDPRPDYQRVGVSVEQATGYARVYQPDDEPDLAAQLAAMRDDGITADEAARIALLNNPGLQAEFFDVGIARADLVQSTLFSNPSLGFALRLPAGGGLAGIEADLAQDIADLWNIPAKKQAAAHALDRAILEVAARAADVVAQAKTGYYAVLAADRSLAIAEESLDLARKVLELSEFRQEAGAASTLDVNLARGVVLEARLAAKEARLAAADARRALAEVLGLQASGTTLVLSDVLPDSPAGEPDAEKLVGAALAGRLDLRAARVAVHSAEQELALEYRRVFPAIELGIAVERGERGRAEGRDLLADTARSSIAAGQLAAPDIEPRSARRVHTDLSIGPSLSLELPIFDQNQAQIARARFAVDRARKRLASLETAITQEVRGAVDRMETGWQVVRFYRDEILPQAQQNLDLSREAYRAGKSSILSVLDAERSYLSARDRYAEAWRVAAASVPELERAVGRPIALILSNTVAAIVEPEVRRSATTIGAGDADSIDSHDDEER